MSLYKRQRELNKLFKKIPKTGFDARDLEDLCSSKYMDTGNAEWIHWSAEIYSFGKWLRKYGYYPSWLPLMIMTDHAPAFYAGDEPTGRTYVEYSGLTTMFYHSKENTDIAKREFANLKKNIYTMYSPIVFCRHYLSIQQIPDAAGTLVFLYHTLPETSDECDKQAYIKQLLSLPEKMLPVSVCIHSHDIKKGAHRIFLEHNIPVFTAGETCDIRFGERLLTVISHFKYTMSNVIGSQTYYCVEMGIPHSIWGVEPVETFQNPDIAWETEYWKKPSGTKKRNDMFKGIYTSITQEQHDIVYKDLGINDGISRIKMAKVLYRAYLSQRPPLQMCKDILYACFKTPLKKSLPFLLQSKIIAALFRFLLVQKYKHDAEMLQKSLQRWEIKS